jgi:hypothetical protein
MTKLVRFPFSNSGSLRIACDIDNNAIYIQEIHRRTLLTRQPGPNPEAINADLNSVHQPRNPDLRTADEIQQQPPPLKQ